MKKTILTMLALLLLNCTFGQHYLNQNKVWIFGNLLGVDFNTSPPTAISSYINQQEGSASVCDGSGGLLFYTEGKTVWDRTGAVMPSGSAIVPFGVASTSQAALILPVPGTTSQYYIFSLEQSPATAYHCHLDYCKVDMTLSGGRGDVISSTAGTRLDSNLSEKMIAVRGNSGNIWLIAHRKDTAQFLVYKHQYFRNIGTGYFLGWQLSGKRGIRSRRDQVIA